MFVKTRGIVLRVTKVSDSGAVVNIFTKEHGLQSFFVKGLQGKRSKAKASYFQPLTMVNIVFRHSRNDTLQTFSEIELDYNYRTATTDITKSTQIFFLNELLYKTLKEESSNPQLFTWIANSLKWLDISGNDFVNFHLVFMIQLTKFLGFYPGHLTESPEVFDMQEGNFVSNTPFHTNYVTGRIVPLLSSLMSTTYDSSANTSLSNKDRKELLNILISYYDLHLPSLGKFKSVEVLAAVFD